MKQIILDTNFILTCVKEKIDFFIELQVLGYKIVIPEEVLQELEKIVNSKQKLHNRNLAKVVLNILKMKINDFETVKLSMKNVDKGILMYALRSGAAIATLDRGLRYKAKGEVVTIRNRNKLVVV